MDADVPLRDMQEAAAEAAFLAPFLGSHLRVRYLLGFIRSQSGTRARPGHSYLPIGGHSAARSSAISPSSVRPNLRMLTASAELPDCSRSRAIFSRASGWPR